MSEANTKEQRIKSCGWFAHADTKCKRCGWEHGPFHILRDSKSEQRDQRLQEFWGCGKCGIGVMCEGTDQPTCDQAADIYMSIVCR